MTREPLPASVDVLIVGARCAGAATALLAARRGARVLLIDRGVAGTDTLSTHALMRGAVVQLARWGVLPAVVAAGTPAIRRTTFAYDGDEVSVAISGKHGVDALYAPRRTVLDRILVDAAAAAGATVVHGLRARDLVVSDTGRVTGARLEDGGGVTHTVHAGLVVGADGRHSTVSRRVGARRTLAGQSATATVFGHFPDVAVDAYRWGYGATAAAGAIPTNGSSCVFVTVPERRIHDLLAVDSSAAFHRELRALDPDLADAVRRSTPLEGLRGFGGLIGGFTESWGPGWALVGDAAYFKDPLTAHGITDALLHAELLADALAAGTDEALAAYERTRTAIAMPVFEATEAIASFDWTMTSIRELHTGLSRVMAGEVEAALATFATLGRRPAPEHQSRQRVPAIVA
jgi:flavin-dependent dehydrogenase